MSLEDGLSLTLSTPRCLRRRSRFNCCRTKNIKDMELRFIPILARFNGTDEASSVSNYIGVFRADYGTPFCSRKTRVLEPGIIAPYRDIFPHGKGHVFG